MNRLSLQDKTTPYSFVSAIDDLSNATKLSDNEMIISKWLADDLQARVGDTIALDYFTIGALRTLEERTHSFIVKEILPAVAISSTHL